MKNFAYVNAPTVDAALEALAAHDNALIVAGGTDVMIGIFSRNINDRTIVDIHAIDELKEIVDNGDTITLGALVTLKQIEKSELLEKDAKCLWQAAQVFADPTTRNSATVGGNLGKASPAGNTLPSLLALDAVLTVAKKGSVREIDIKDYFKGPGKTALEADEMITKVTIKKSHNCCFIKLGLRKAMAISVASVCVTLDKSECGCVKEAHVAMGSVAATPVRCANAEAALVKGGDDLTAALEAALAEDIHPIDDFRATGKYRAMVAPGLVERAYKHACGC